MRTALNIDNKLLQSANKLTSIKEKTSLVKSGIEALICIENKHLMGKGVGFRTRDKRLKQQAEQLSVQCQGKY